MSREQKVGLFFVGGVILFAVFIELTVGTGLIQRRYPLYAEYQDVQGLAPGAQVWVAGVRSGTVESVELAGDRVRVRLGIHGGTVVRSNATARLDFQALSGQRFVAIDLGGTGAAALAPGATISSEEPTGISQMVDELSRVAESVVNLTDSLHENQDDLLRSVNAMIEENRNAIAATLQSVDHITARLDSGEGTLGKLLHDDRLYERAVLALENLNETFGDVRQITGPIARGEGPIGQLLDDDDLYEDMRETLASLSLTARNVEEITETIANGEGTVGKMLVDDDFYVRADEALQGVKRATQGIEDQAPLSVIGTLLGVLF